MIIPPKVHINMCLKYKEAAPASLRKETERIDTDTLR